MRWTIRLLAFVVLVWAEVAWAQNTFPAMGNAGIGTTNPQGALHIVRPGGPPAGLLASENGLLLGIESTAGFKWVQSYGGPLSLNPQGNNVGIGRTTPTHRLDIGGPTRFRVNGSTNLLVSGDADDAHIDLIKETNATPAARLEFNGFTDQSRHEGEIAFFTRSASDSALVERMRIGSDGSITIGTGGQVRVSGASVSLLNPIFQTLRTVTRAHACINELGGGPFTIGNCLSAAEYAPTVDTGSGLPQAGDLVSLLPGTDNSGDTHAPFVVAKTSQPCDGNLLGFISAPEQGASGSQRGDTYLPLAIYGYFPAKVTLENGPIRRGNPITSSSKPGYGMKATEECRIIGYALEDADREGTIQVFAHLTEHTAPGVAALHAQIQAMEVRLAALEKTDAAAVLRTLSSSLPPTWLLLSGVLMGGLILGRCWCAWARRGTV